MKFPSLKVLNYKKLFINSISRSIEKNQMTLGPKCKELAIKIIFNAPLFKKNSHKIMVENSFSGKNYIKYFKSKWSFDEQTKGFVELIKKIENIKIFLLQKMVML